MQSLDCKINTTYQYQHTISSSKKSGNKKGNTCYCLNYLEKKGAIQLIIKEDSPNIYISKLSLISFDDNFDVLLEKGKVDNLEEIEDENFTSCPDKGYYGYYEQRYYYYSKYDQGIKMDKECKYIFYY